MQRRAAIYARYSTVLQSDRSIEDQVELCRGYLKREGYQEFTVFEDRAKTSETLIGRTGLAHLLDAARQNSFDAVVVECVDRISREPADLHQVAKHLRFSEVDIISANEGVQSDIQIGVRGLMGTMFLSDLRQKIHRGMSGNIREGLSAGGKPYGYLSVLGKPGELEIEETEAEVIHRIHQAYADGASPRAIACTLNAESILPPRGTKWNASTLNGSAERGYGILRNAIYVGVLVWNRVRMVRDPMSGKRVSRVNSQDNWKYAEVPHLRIIDEDLWDAVQARLSKQSLAKSSGKSTKQATRPFSGLVKCGCCGGGMSIHDRKGRAIRIRCSTHRESGSCSNNGKFRLDEIEAAIFSSLTEHLMHPTYLQEYIEAYDAKRRELSAAPQPDRSKLERSCAEARNLFEKRLGLFERGILDGVEGEDKLTKAKAALRKAEARLEELETNAPEIKFDTASPERFAKAVHDLTQSTQSTEVNPNTASMTALRKLVSEIIVTPAEEGGVPVEVRGRLSALITNPALQVGCLVVAEEGLEPPTRGL